MRRAYLSSEELQKYRNEKLREIVKYAYEHVVFYREKFRKARIEPDDIKTVADLAKLPIVSKEEVRRNFDRMISNDYDISKLKMLRTSGSTGEPLHFCITPAEDEFRKARHLRANIACGQKMRDRWVTITSPSYFNQATKLQRILRLYAPISVSVFDDVAAQSSTIGKLKPDVLDGYASALHLLAREVKDKGIETIKPRFLISGADLIDLSSRRVVEEVFDVPFFDQYGAAEFERLAWQCKEKKEYHIDADCIVMQFVDGAGEVVAPGETGEIVCTSLFNYAMPFIRYAVGDMGTGSSEKDSCICGRTFPLMRVMEGRKDAVAILPDGRSLTSFAFVAGMYQLSFYKDIEQFRVVQETPNLFRFLIKMKSNLLEGKEKTAREELKDRFGKMLNVDVGEADFEVEFVENIPRDKSGKFKIFISEIC